MELLLGVVIGALLTIVPVYLQYQYKQPYDPEFNNFEVSIAPAGNLEPKIAQYAERKIQDGHISANRNVHVESVYVQSGEWIVQYQIETPSRSKDTQKDN